MRPRLIIALLLLVTAPVALLSWLGMRMAEDEQTRVAQRFEQVIDSKLSDLATNVERAIQVHERDLLTATEEFPALPHTVRSYIRKSESFSHVLVFDEKDRLVFPPYAGDKSAAESAFLERTRGLWESRVFKRGRSELNDAPTRDHGWRVWYWGGGLNLLFWRHLQDGRTVAIEVDRVRLLSLVVGVLPPTEAGSDERTALLDSGGQLVYQWGAGTGEFRIERALPAPLSAWKLSWGGGVPDGASGLDFSMLAALIAVGVLLAGLAFYLYRESARELRLAAQRVSFVNQVSHELKTPLTNIRMYAELLQEEVDPDEDEKAGRYVQIMVNESQRLSRLIGNILTFARKQRERLQLRPSRGVVDEVVHDVIDQFRPSLDACSVTAQFTSGAPSEVRFDSDVVGQILGNLLSNVEKYAPSGTVLIETEQNGDQAMIRVTDNGPGIPKAQQARVFDPFHRLSNALTDAATGTGIGLGIARDLARLHGGDLTLIPTETGACFEARIRTEPIA